MDSTDPRALAALYDVHHGTPRAGPGDLASAGRAFALAGRLPDRPRILDVGCGPGAQTLHVAELAPHGHVTAVDNHLPFLNEVARRAAAAGVAERVVALAADMAALPLSEGAFDLIWCEGAAYIMGLEAALTAWRPLLADGGRLAVSEAVWLRDDPPEPLRVWWEAGYPALADVPTNLVRCESCGYDVLGHFVLPESAWWDGYYEPMQRRLEALRPRYAADPAGSEVLAEHEQEIEFYRRYGAYYGYAFFVLAPAAGGRGGRVTSPPRVSHGEAARTMRELGRVAVGGADLGLRQRGCHLAADAAAGTRTRTRGPVGRRRRPRRQPPRPPSLATALCAGPRPGHGPGPAAPGADPRPPSAGR